MTGPPSPRPSLPPQRNPSTCSTASNNTTASSSSSLEAAPMIPPPIETRTAATSEAQLPSPEDLQRQEDEIRVHGQTTTTGRRRGSASKNSSASPTTPRARRFPLPVNQPPTYLLPEEVKPQRQVYGSDWAGSEGGRTPLRINVQPSTVQRADGPRSAGSDSPYLAKELLSSSPVHRSRGRSSEDRIMRSPTSEIPNPREREQSGPRRPSINDFTIGEVLGRGSYSTVVYATSNFSSSPSNLSPPANMLGTSPSASSIMSHSSRLTSSVPAFAIKIIDQAHLIAERKVKYAHIERDALVRLSARPPSHARGSSYGSVRPKNNRKSTASLGSVIAQVQGGGEHARRGSASTQTNRMSVATNGSDSSSATLSMSIPSIAVEQHRRTPSLVDAEAVIQEHGPEEKMESLNLKNEQAPVEERRPKERTSLPVTGPSAYNSPQPVSKGRASHPGIVRLHQTFADKTSLYFVLDLASNGELLGFIKRYGSLDLFSARYYAAQLIDTIEFMHERGVIHRDIKPENILLDEDMRIKVTDFGSAKLLGPETEQPTDGKKRSFVGTAEYVSPEVLRNDPANAPADIWAFGCVLFQFIAGRPPFRGATDYLTFQKILNADMEWPEGFDARARDLIQRMLKLNPAERPTATEVKTHPYFETVDFNALWVIPAPVISTGLVEPSGPAGGARVNSDVWDVFDDESEGEMEMEEELALNRPVADSAIRAVDGTPDHTRDEAFFSSQDLEAPRPRWLNDGEAQKSAGGRKSRGSAGSGATDSSGAARVALDGLLHNIGGVDSPVGSTRSRETAAPVSRPGSSQSVKDWSSLLLRNERVLYSSAIHSRSASLFQLAPKRRTLILTDFPRLICVKEDTGGGEQHKIKAECVFLSRRSAASIEDRGMSGGALNLVTGVVPKGSKTLIVQTVARDHTFMADSTDLRDHWLRKMNRLLD